MLFQEEVAGNYSPAQILLFADFIAVISSLMTARQTLVTTVVPVAAIITA